MHRRRSFIKCTKRVDRKNLICRVGDAAGIFGLGQFARRSLGSYVRAVNYHATPPDHEANFERQLRFYADHFESAGMERLRSVLGGGRHRRPAIAITFDDGYRSNYDVAAPLLEKHGFTGWFFVSSGRLRDLGVDGRTIDGEDADAFMSSAELRNLIRRGHVVGCHTHSHVRLKHDWGDERLYDEIVASRKRLQALLDDPIETFCWVGGEEWAYSAAAQAQVEKAGFPLAFTTNCQVTTAKTDPLQIDRTNVEADWPLHKVRFYLSGAMDLAYMGKSRRVAEELGQSGERPQFSGKVALSPDFDPAAAG